MGNNLQEQGIRNRQFQFLICQVKDGTEIDFYAASDGVEIRIEYDAGGSLEGAYFILPNTDNPVSVKGSDGGMLSDEETQTLIYELLDSDPRIMERMTLIREEEEAPSLG